MQRLNNEMLSVLDNEKIQTPGYDRAQLNAGIVHIGIGAFHRAHQAFFTEAVLNKFGGDWGIVGCSLRSASVADQLNPQDGLYTMVERSSVGEKFQVIGAVKRVVVGPDDPRVLIDAMAAEQTKIVSLTVTEKGYCHDPATGALNLEHPDILHDLANPDAPKSAIGYIVSALKVRKQSGIKSFTALSCDNLPDNGKILRAAVTGFAERLDPELAGWIEKNTTFPCTMIDRIVPATTSYDRDGLESVVGYKDEGVVVTEPFAQWVIEDAFCNGRPQWDEVGALLVEDVSVFEDLKLKLLNGSHSLLAYSGYLAGFETVSDAMAEPAFEKLVTHYMDHDVGSILKVPAGFDVDAYKQELRDRFNNSSLKHKTYQIAMDGSQKLPQRLLGTLREQLQREDGSHSVILLAIAAWIKYVGGVDERGEPIPVQDPMADQLRNAHAEAASPSDLIEKMLDIGAVFGTDLKKNKRLVAELTEVYDALDARGVINVISGYC